MNFYIELNFHKSSINFIQNFLIKMVFQKIYPTAKNIGQKKNFFLGGGRVVKRKREKRISSWRYIEKCSLCSEYNVYEHDGPLILIKISTNNFPFFVSRTTSFRAFCNYVEIVGRKRWHCSQVFSEDTLRQNKVYPSIFFVLSKYVWMNEVRIKNTMLKHPCWGWY